MVNDHTMENPNINSAEVCILHCNRYVHLAFELVHKSRNKCTVISIKVSDQMFFFYKLQKIAKVSTRN